MNVNNDMKVKVENEAFSEKIVKLRFNFEAQKRELGIKQEKSKTLHSAEAHSLRQENMKLATDNIISVVNHTDAYCGDRQQELEDAVEAWELRPSLPIAVT